MTPEQKQAILDNAPEGATHYATGLDTYYKLNIVGSAFVFHNPRRIWLKLNEPLDSVGAVSLDSLRENWSEADERRMDVIPQNGNDGDHYDELEEYIVIQNGIDSGPFNKTKAHALAQKWAEETPGKPSAVCRVLAVYQGRVEVEKIK